MKHSTAPAPGRHPGHSPAHVPGRGLPPVLPGDLAARVGDLRNASKAANTVRAYQADWRRWQAWCDQHAQVALPAHPDTVAAYLADQAGLLKVSTLRRHLATISKAHQVAGLVSPCSAVAVQDTLAGLRRTLGTARDEAPGLLKDGLRSVVAGCGDDLAGLRDRALLLVGWCAALRRSEVAGLRWGDLAPDPDGLWLTLVRSKTDQDGAGRLVGVPRVDDLQLCPVAALHAWQTALGALGAHLVAGGAPVFPQVTRWGQPGAALSGHAVALVIQRRAAAAGLPIRYRGHSLRKGLVQAAKLAGVDDSAVMATTGHKSVTMLRQYQATAGLVAQSPAKRVLA